MTKSKTNPTPERIVGARVSDELFARFAEVAKSHERSVSGELRWLMQRHVDGDATAEPATDGTAA